MTVTIEVDAVLFDSDGVLVDSHAQVDRAWRDIAREYGLDLDRLAPELAGVPARDTLARYVADHDLPTAVTRLEQLEIDGAAGTLAIPGAVELLDALPAGRWTIVTSAARRLGDARWAAAGITAPINAVTADDVRVGKPAPDPFLAGAARLGVAAERCVVFEDSAAGGRAGHAAGARVVAVGLQPWDVAPVARIADLRSVRVERAGGGTIRLVLDPLLPAQATTTGPV